MDPQHTSLSDAQTTSTSATLTESAATSNLPDGILRLRGAENQRERRVTWTEEVVDNEGLGKKKTKICCIYHKPRQFGDSSSEDSDSSSSSDDDGGNLNEQQHAENPGSRKSASNRKDHKCSSGKRKNAYEKQSDQKKKT